MLRIHLSFVLDGQSIYKGSVSDATKGEPLVFVNIQLSKTTNGTVFYRWGAVSIIQPKR
jgi:hypothetical protein